MKSLKIVVIVFGFLLLFFGGYLYALDLQASSVSPVVVVSPVFTPTELVKPRRVLATNVETTTPVPTLTATPLPLPVNYYILNEEIDLSSGRSTAMMIQLPQGGNILSTWADAIAYQSGDDDLTISPFDLNAGTIYTMLGDTAVVVAHSGQRKKNWDLFASSIDRYLRAKDVSNPKLNESVTLGEGTERLKGMIGSMIYICQSGKKMEVFTVFERCPGEVVKAKLVGATMIGPELMNEYGVNILNLREWLTGVYPEAGFDLISKNTGLILVTCVQKFADQPVLSGVHGYEYNRVFLAIEVIP